jgi:hypothetical protein
MSYFAFYNGSPWEVDGKALILYIVAESCPYCAATRWPLTVTLMVFGNFGGLSYMMSSSTYVFPDMPTFTYRDVKYSSPYVVFQPYEDRAERPLTTPLAITLLCGSSSRRGSSSWTSPTATP